LADLFASIEPELIVSMVQAKPTGRYARLAGFFYEWLTREELTLPVTIGGNYVDALDPKKYIVADGSKRVARWRVRDNLLGHVSYCPIVRRSEALDAAIAAPLEVEIENLMRDFPPELFARANDYLYLRETRSTYGIERETMPQAKRCERFVALLREAGADNLWALLQEGALTEKQNLIVDPRYAAQGFRDDQSYVGEQLPNFAQRIHYICPPPEWVPSMMGSLASCAEASHEVSPLVRAAIIAFSFVFIHPFEDGNGRLHRFLIHDILHRGGLMKAGLMLPVSATMLRLMGEYDKALESFSRSLLAMADYEVDDDGRLTLLNAEQLRSYFRYPDLTTQSEYLAKTVAITVREDVSAELRFLQNYDVARAAVLEAVDLPDRRCDLMLQLLHQNRGKLSKGKRDKFSEITDEELERIEAVFMEAFKEIESD
jgi:tetratricopeptide (TPR) repeat protein